MAPLITFKGALLFEVVLMAWDALLTSVKVPTVFPHGLTGLQYFLSFSLVVQLHGSLGYRLLGTPIEKRQALLADEPIRKAG